MSVERLFYDEAEALRFLLEQEFGMTYNTFIGPDGSTIGYKHGEKCECAECDTAHWLEIEKRETNRKENGMTEHQAFYEAEMSGDSWFVQHPEVMEFIMEHEQHTEEQPDTVEVAIGQGKTATFYREHGGELLLENDESAFYLDAEETYRLLALLQAELKGNVS
jgi:hypothetical protein